MSDQWPIWLYTAFFEDTILRVPIYRLLPRIKFLLRYEYFILGMMFHLSNYYKLKLHFCVFVRSLKKHKEYTRYIFWMYTCVVR